MQDRLDDIEKRYPVGSRVRVTDPMADNFGKIGEVNRVFADGAYIRVSVVFEYSRPVGVFTHYEVIYLSTDVAPEFG